MAASEGGSPLKTLAILGAWLVVGLLPVVTEIQDLRLAFGLTGRPGTITVDSCVDYGSGKNERTDCRGTFVPDDRDGANVTNVHLPPESDEGESFPARISADGDSAHRTGTQGMLAALTMPALALLILAALPWAAFFMLTGRNWGRGTAVSIGAVAVPALVLLCAGFVASYL